MAKYMTEHVVNGETYKVKDKESRESNVKNPTIASPVIQLKNMFTNTQYDDPYSRPALDGGQIEKFGDVGVLIAEGTFVAGETEFYISRGLMALDSGTVYTLYIKTEDDTEIFGVSLKGKKSGSDTNSILIDTNDNNVSLRRKNVAYHFMPKYDYTGVYANLYKLSADEYEFDNTVIYIYLVPGNYDSSYFDKSNKLKPYRVQEFSDVSFAAGKGNLVAGLVREHQGVVNGVYVDAVGGVSLPEENGLILSGTLPKETATYITKAGIPVKAGHTYTMYLKTASDFGENVSFAIKNNYGYVLQNGANVSTRKTNHVFTFVPDADYDGVYFTVWQNTLDDGYEFDNDIVYLYLCEGEFTEYDFDRTAVIEDVEKKASWNAGIVDEIRNKNMVDGTQYPYLANSNLNVYALPDSGFRFNGYIAPRTRTYFSRGMMNFYADRDYTMYIKTARTTGFKAAFSLYYGGPYQEQGYVKMHDNNVSTRALNRAYHFRPDADYENVYLNIWADTDENMYFDNDVFYIYIVEGMWNDEDFDLFGRYEAERYEKHSVTQYLESGLPILYLFGDTAAMTKDDAVDLTWRYGEDTGTCTLKWQGASSIAYPKKNYTIKLDHNIDVGWGNQKKYVFKGNFIDNTSALNICGANLWSQIVANRGTSPAIEAAVNNGAMDGFPVILMLNNEFHGLFTWNTPKDKWTFGMGSDVTEYIVTAEQHTTATQFKGTTDLEGEDFELEYADDSVSADTVKTALNTMISAIINSTGSSWESAVEDYMDIDTAIDYMIFSALVTNIDGVDKNFILTTYDGEKWWLNAYDVDSIFGNYWTGGSYVKASESTTSFAGMNNTSRLFHLIYTYSTAKLIARYETLRAGILSEENVYDIFYNFCVRIPKRIVDMDNAAYPDKPGTYTETLSRIMENYRMRCKFLDAEIDALGG